MNFKSATIAFVFAIVLFLFFYFEFNFSLLWLALPVLIYSGLIVYGSATIQSNFFAKVFCNSDTAEKIIAITFDDGPNSKHTSEILQTLKGQNVVATFFVIGKNIAGNETLLKQIDSEGHTIGNHTFTHSYLIDFFSKIKLIKEMNQTSDAVFSVTGKRIKYFRPPYGVTTPNLVNAAKALNYQLIGWDVRSLDTTNENEEKILKRVTEKIKSGSIILFHDTSAKTNAVLKQTINFANSNGFKIVGMDELINN